MGVDMRNILITGAAGSLGHTIANLMVSKDTRVLGFLMPKESDALLDPRVILVRGDVLDMDSLENAFTLLGKHGIVIHCAGMISIDPKVSQRIYQVNVQGTKNILSQCEKHQVSHVIYVSSVHAIPELKKGQSMGETTAISPDKVFGHYSKSKAMATNAVMDHMAKGYNTTIVYPSGIISDEDVKNAFMTQMVKDYLNKTMKIGVKGGYDFVDVRDVAQAIITIIDQEIVNEHFILSNRYYSVMKLLGMLYELTGLQKVRLSVPLGLVKMVLPFKLINDKRRHKISLYTAESLKILKSNSNYSHQKAQQALGYHPRDIQETFEDLVKRLSAQSNPSF
jgi:dihydroflavonol-4-reductase